MENFNSPIVSCSNCRALCCYLEVPLIDDSDEQVPTEYVQTDFLGRATLIRSEDGFCSALDRKTYKCTIYEKRPFLCRDYEVGNPECLREREKL